MMFTHERFKVMGAFYPSAMAQDTDADTAEAYHNAVARMADVIADEADEYPHVNELVWEELDSSAWILYTDKSIDVLRYANNDPDEWKHLVGDGDSWQEVIQAMAYKAMEHDLYDELRTREGVEL